MSHIQKILVPVDGSEASIAALEQATTLAADLNASVVVLQVTDSSETDHDLELAITTASSRLDERLTRRTMSGEPVKKILDLAEAERPGMIVIGTHGRVGRLHSLVGSVAESIVRNAPCPVLTVRHAAGDEESFAERIHHRSGIARTSH